MQTVYSASPDLPRKPPGWVWWHVVVVVFLFAFTIAGFFLLMWLDDNRQRSIAGLRISRNLNLFFGIAWTFTGGSLIAACGFAWFYGNLAVRKFESWVSAKARHARERGLNPDDRVAGYIVVSGNQNHLLLRSAMPLAVNMLMRVVCFSGTIAMAFVLPLHALSMPAWIGFAVFLAGIRWAMLRPYMQKIAISPTAADGEPGFLFEYRKYIVLRAYSVVSFTEFLSLSTRESGTPSSLRIYLNAKDQKPKKLASISPHRTTRGQATILVAAIEGMHLRFRRQAMIEKYGDEVLEIVR